jgi:hypothetical protein
LKVALDFEFEGGLILNVVGEVETVADLKKMGQRLVALPAGVSKLMPGASSRKLVRVYKSKDEHDKTKRVAA